MIITTISLQKGYRVPSFVQVLILFGSHARGFARPDSDIDVAVVADHPLNLGERNELYVVLSQGLNCSEDDIDLVDMYHAPPLLQYQIACTGKLLYGDASQFIHFQVMAWKRYCDTAWFRRRREAWFATHYGI